MQVTSHSAEQGGRGYHVFEPRSKQVLSSDVPLAFQVGFSRRSFAFDEHFVK
jgi:hypothetical protein